MFLPLQHGNGRALQLYDSRDMRPLINVPSAHLPVRPASVSVKPEKIVAILTAVSKADADAACAKPILPPR